MFVEYLQEQLRDCKMVSIVWFLYIELQFYAVEYNLLNKIEWNNTSHMK